MAATDTPTDTLTDALPADPRPALRTAIDWTAQRLASIPVAAYGDPTPCDDMSVRELAAHLVATLHKLRVAGEGGDPRTLPFFAEVADGDWARAYRAAADELWAVWDDDSVLDRTVTAPFGTVPGAVMASGFLGEELVHGWDVAVATGQDAEAPRDVVEIALDAAERLIPARFRGDGMPFSEPVDPRPDAGATERLANWSGRAFPE